VNITDGRHSADTSGSGSLTANPAGLVSTAIGLIGTLVGGGALLDNRRKDRKLQEGKTSG